MDPFSGLFILAFIVLFIGGPYFYASHVGRKKSREIDALRQELHEVSARVEKINRVLQELEKRGVAPASEPIKTESGVSVPSPIQVKIDKPVEQPKPVVVPPLPAPPPLPSSFTTSPTVAKLIEKHEAKVVSTPQPSALRKEFAPLPIQNEIATSVTKEAVTSSGSAGAPAATRTVVPPAQTIASEKKITYSMEEKVGANWLVKAGALLVFCGVVAGVSIIWSRISPVERDMLLYLFGGGMLWLGIFLEKRANFLIIGRSLIGTGWATVFFTTYALYHADTTRIVDSLVVDMVLMLIVAAAMVWHSLRYNSQLLTGFAFLLGFYAISANHGTGAEGAGGLLAGPVLIAGMIYLVLERSWWELEVFGILAAYVTHFLWLQPLVKTNDQGVVIHFPGYEYSVAALCVYWMVFRASYVLRHVRNTDEENVSTVAALLNSFAFLALMKFQSVHPELAFYALLALGSVELVLGQIAQKRERRMAFLVLSTIGICLLTAAIPFKLAEHPGKMSLVWLAGAQAFFFIGIKAEEVLFRRMGKLISMLAACTLVFTTGFTSLQTVMDNPNLTGPDATTIHLIGIAFLICAATLWMNAHGAGRKWSNLFLREFDAAALVVLSWTGATLAAIGVTLITPDTWLPVGYAALAAAIALIGEKMEEKHWLGQSLVLSLAAAANLLFSHPGFKQEWHGVKLEIYVGAAVMALVYLCARSMRRSDDTIGEAAAPFLTWLASLVMTVVLYRALPEVWRAPALAIYALAIVMAVRIIKDHEVARQHMAMQSHVLAAVTFCYTFAFNLVEVYRGTPIQLWTIAICAAVLYALSKLTDIAELELPDWMPKAQSWLASTLITWLLWYQLKPVSVAVGWAVFGLIIFEIGIWRKAGHLRWQAYIAFLCSFIRIFIANIGAESVAGSVSPVVYTIIPLALIYYYAYWRLLEADGNDLEEERKIHIAGWLASFGTLAIATVIRFELKPETMVVTGWAALLVALILTAWVTGRTVFLYQAIAGVVPVAFRFVTYNLYHITANDGSFSSLLFTNENAVVVLLLLCLPVAFKLRNTEATDDAFGGLELISQRPEQVFFFAPVAMLVLFLRQVMDGGWITLAWGVVAITAFVFALIVGERSFRLCGLGLLVLCILKITFFDFWNMATGERFAVLLGLGVILMVVGALYGKNRDKLKELL